MTEWNLITYSGDRILVAPGHSAGDVFVVVHHAYRGAASVLRADDARQMAAALIAAANEATEGDS